MTAASMGRKPGPLAAALSAPPTLDGAACIGRWSLFDPQHDHEPAADTTRRHLAAARICTTTCPVLAACHRWAATLPATHRPAGVLAGTPPTSRVSRADVSDNLSLTPAGRDRRDCQVREIPHLSPCRCARRAGGPA